MMSRKLALALLVLAAPVVIHAQAEDSPGRRLLKQMANAMGSAESLTVHFSYQDLAGNKKDFAVDFARPNKLRLDTASSLIVADGESFISLQKSENSYSRQAEDPMKIIQAMLSEPLKPWLGLFNPAMSQAVVNARTLGNSVRGGVTLIGLQVQPSSDTQKTITFFLDPKDNLPRQIEFKNGSEQRLLLVDKLELNGKVAEDAFLFVPPAGAKEVTPEEQNADVWYSSLPAALAVAEKTHKMVFVDFYADW